MSNLVKYLGIPWAVNKSSYEESDCYGLVMLYAKNELGLELPRYFYNVDNNESTSEKAIAEAHHNLGRGWVKKDKPEIGDVLTFIVGGHETHCGIYVGDGDFLHVFNNATSCLEELSGSRWGHRHRGTFQWKP